MLPALHIAPFAPSDAASTADQAFLSRLELSLAAAVSADDALARAQAHLVLAPAAKRLRPRFALLCARMADKRAETSDVLLHGAAGVELIHAASLLHDDIVDHADMRRGRPSANAAFGVSTALLAGDRLLAEALGLFRPQVLGPAITTIRDMSSAAMLEVDLRNNADATVEACMQIADGKTAALFALAGRVAADAIDSVPAMGRDELTKRFHAAGLALGRAFQIADDVDDLLKDDPERANDLIERTPTLPLALGAELTRGLWTAHGDAPVSRAAAVACAEALRQSGACDQALARAKTEVDNLKDALAPFVDSLEYKSIIAVAEHLVGG